jgi:ketosteroid isomerase-like protein
MVLSSALVVMLLQASVPSVDPEKDPFQSLETRVSTAIQAKDIPALDQLLAKDFAFNLFLEGRAPDVMNRNEWLKTSDIYTLVGFEIRYLAARVFGNVAIVRLQPHRTAFAGKTSQIDRSGEFAVVDVWTKDGDTWRLSVRHLSRPDTIKR